MHRYLLVGFVLLVLLVLLTYRTEGFIASSHTAFVEESQKKFNDLTNTINLTHPSISLTPMGAADLQQALGSLSAQPTSQTYHLSPSVPYQTPQETPATLLQAQKCETAGKTCAAFDDPSFAANCGMSFDNNGVNSIGQVFTGGLYVSPDDRKQQEKRFTTVQQTGSAPYDPFKVYQPTIGRASSGKFSLSKDSCIVVKEQVDCAAKQTFGVPNCTQCYTSQTFSRVGPDTGRLPSILHLYGVGTVNMVKADQSSLLNPVALRLDGPVNVTLPADSEGSTYAIGVSTNGDHPYLCGYLEGPTARGTFKLDVFNIVQSDTTSGAKPRITGTKTVGGFRCFTLMPGQGKTSMSLACLMPFSFINGFDGDSLACDNGPIITRADSATFLESDPCFGKGNAPGTYKLECLQTRWMELGGTMDGTGYPSTAEKANAIQRLNGQPLDIDAIVDKLAAMANSAQTGQDANGNALSIPDWNSVSMYMTGIPITNPCDGPNNAAGPVSNACASYLYNNQGAGTRIGSTYTLPSKWSSATKEGFSTVDSYPKPEGAMNPDTTGQAFAQGKSVAALQQAYDAENRTANSNNLPNAVRASAIKNVYGIDLKPITTNRHDFDVRIPANQPTQTYDDLKEFCEDKGMRLCNSGEICDMATRTVSNPELTSEFPGDNWIAVGDKDNQWLTLSHMGDTPGTRYCKTHMEVGGYLPPWGNSRDPQNWERLAKCCPAAPKGSQTILAQYIRFQYNHTECLNLQQVGVQSTADPASQLITPQTNITKSSGYYGDQFPIENVKNQMGNTFTHTSCFDVPWMEINLGTMSPIYQVVLLNRVDCCRERVLGTTLILMDSQRTPLYHSAPINTVSANYFWFPPSPGVYGDWNGKPKPDPSYSSVGCWKDSGDRALTPLDGSDAQLTDNYQSRQDAINKCYEAAKARGMTTFAVQDGGWCSASADPTAYKKYGPATNCSGGKGGGWANDVYQIGDENLPAPTLPTNGDNGTTTCERYCSGIQGHAWNNEFPADWNGAACAGVGPGVADCYSQFTYQPGTNQCICKKTGTGWRLGGWLNQ